MAEYYPLLAKAVGSLPNSTPETRRVVYERARKALIGQLRTLHPPVPDEDIEHESVELDRAIARVEDELAQATPAEAVPDAAAPQPPAPRPRPPLTPRAIPPISRPGSGSLGPGAMPFAPLRTKAPVPKPSVPVVPDLPPPPSDPVPEPQEIVSQRAAEPLRPPAGNGRARLEVQRPIAPQPPTTKGPKRQMWIIWVGLGVVALVAVAAWKLRDHPEALVRAKPTEQSPGDSGKSSERVGDNTSTSTTPPATDSTPVQQEAAAPPAAATPPQTQAPPADQGQTASPANNPEVPVAQRAAMLVEAPDEPNKVKTFIGRVLWKLNNVSNGPSDAVGLGVEADIDVPDDNLKAVVTFEKNTDSSLPASHTIKIRYIVQPDSTTGDVAKVSVPMMRKEDRPEGEPLAGATVPVIQNSFLVGLSPGNAETANMELLKTLPWIDIPMVLTSGKIAKLTFEKGDVGDRDLNEAIAAWQKP